jgi:hypothetical protein
MQLIENGRYQSHSLGTFIVAAIGICHEKECAALITEGDLPEIIVRPVADLTRLLGAIELVDKRALPGEVRGVGWWLGQKIASVRKVNGEILVDF